MRAWFVVALIGCGGGTQTSDAAVCAYGTDCNGVRGRRRTVMDRRQTSRRSESATVCDVSTPTLPLSSMHIA
jgi:hypothetical protein